MKLEVISRLILVRHGKSEWNKLGRWTGRIDVSLAEEGRQEARGAGEAIKELQIDAVHTSKLKRARETFDEMRNVLGRGDLSVTAHEALNERDYGAYTGRNKWEIEEEVGKDQFQRLRRGWDVPIPKGETLKDVYARVVPYYEGRIVPQLLAGKNVLVVAHGNTLRALVKHIENISDLDVRDIEIATGEVCCYSFSQDGNMVHKDIRRQ
jgi:2,3-bisphosphoglycerate-dependent phosphoglycerate mutase